jgi:serine/threonine protein kinase
LSYIHSCGIIHRDLKPENILVELNEKNGVKKIKITDFGLAKMISFPETCNEPVGTLAYAAPEVLLTKNYSSQVDVWSCGIIFHLL